MVINAMKLQSRSFVYSALFLAAVLLLADVSLFDTVKILIVCLIQIYAGAELLEKFFYRRSLSIFEKFGIGLPLGVAISIAFDLLFVRSPITQVAWLIPLVVIVLICKFTESASLQKSESSRYQELEILKWIGISVFALLGQEWFWPMPVAVFFAMALWLSGPKDSSSAKSDLRKSISYILYGLGTLILIIGIVIRPNSWWIEDSDFGFYEAFTVSLTNWGTSENLLATGTGLKYHWFVYEWSGLVSKVADLSSWVMLSRGVIIIGCFSVACSIWLVLERVVTSKKQMVASLLVICFFDSVTSWGSGFRIGFIVSPSQLVGFVWLFAIFAVVLEQEKQRVKFSSFLYFVLFSGAMLSKISHGVVALGGLLLLSLVEMIRERKFFVARTRNAVVATLTTFLWFFITYSGAENARIKFLKFPEEILGTLKLWSGKPLWLAALILILGLVGYQSFGLFVGLCQKETRKSTAFIFSSGVAMTGLIITLSIESLFGSQLYFLHSASAIVLLVVAPLTVDAFVRINSQFASRWRLITVSIFGFLAAAVSWMIPTIDSGSENATWVSVSKSGVFVIPVVVAIVISINKSLRVTWWRFLSFALVGLCVLGMGFSMSNWTMILKREFPSFNRNEQFNLGTQDLNTAMQWMRMNTSDDELFASNNESFLLSALSHRRGLLQGEEYVRRHTVLDDEWTRELAQRRDLINRSFKSSLAIDVDGFLAFGVGTLVIDKSVPDFTLVSFPSGVSTVFENETFTILKIG